MSTCRIYMMEPVEKRLGWPNYNRGTVDRVHGRNENGGLRRLSVVVIEHSAESLATLHLAGASHLRRIGQDEAVGEPLVIAFSV